MDARTKKRIEMMTAYVKNQVFNRKDTFLRNLMVIKYNPDLEWFNCACVAQMGGDSLENDLVAYPYETWCDILNFYVMEENEDTMKDLSYLIVPYFNLDENVFTVKTMRVYLRSHLDLETSMELEENKNARLRYYMGVESPFQQILEDYDFTRFHLNEKWYQQFILNYLNSYNFFKEADINLKKTYYAIMLITYGNNLQIELKKEHIKIDFTLLRKAADPFTQYIQIYHMLTNFLTYMYEFLVRLSMACRSREERGNESTNHVYENGYDLLKMLDVGLWKSDIWYNVINKVESAYVEKENKFTDKNEIIGSQVQTEEFEVEE